MRITEAERLLPNTLHDANLLSFAVDYENRTATLRFDADFSNYPEKTPEYRKVSLLIHGLQFISVPAPSAEYLGPPNPKFSKRNTPWVLGFEQWRDDLEVENEMKEAVRALPPDVFCEWTFATNWNRFIVIAARDSRIEIEK